MYTRDIQKVINLTQMESESLKCPRNVNSFQLVI